MKKNLHENDVFILKKKSAISFNKSVGCKRSESFYMITCKKSLTFEQTSLYKNYSLYFILYESFRSIYIKKEFVHYTIMA